MSQEVQYEVSLKDLLTPKLREMESQAGKTETAIHGIGEAGHQLTHMLTGLGISFAIFKGFEFIESGVEAFHKLHAAEAQVEAGLESTHHAAGLTFEELERGAINLASQFKYSRAEITDMQATMVTFTSVAKDKFGEAEQAVVDMATRMHQDLQSTTVQVGKALQDPIHGITALRRVGVNFNETQTEMVKHMVTTGHSAQAQAYILKELSTEFGGSAKAAANADPYFKFNKTMGSIKMTTGELVNSIVQKLMPAMEWLVMKVKDSLGWLQKHKEIIGPIATGLGVAAGAILVVAGALKIWTGIQWLLNASLWASPLTWIVAGIVAATAAVVYCYNHFAKFRAVLLGVWGVIKEFGRIVSDIFQGVWHVIHGVFTFNPKEITSGFSQAADAMLDAGKRMATSFKSGYDEGMADFNKDQADEKKEHTLIPTVGKTKPGLDVVGGATPDKTTAPKNTGTKNVKIDIKINNLVNGFTINTTTVKEGTDKLRDHVTQVLLSAVNDSQIVGAE